MTPSHERVHVHDAKLVWTDQRNNRRHDPLWTGSIHYWRTPKKCWASGILACKQLGLYGIDTYVPWSEHEIALDGSIQYRWGDNHDLIAFLQLIADHDMFAIVRIGPQAGAELPRLGIPQHVIDEPECQARSAQQVPVVCPFPPLMFPAPSYASTLFRNHVDRWYTEVARLLAPHVQPYGPIAIVQIDNEAGYYFRASSFDQDYHPDALDQYRQFLKNRHGSLRQISKVYNAGFSRWSEVVPPAAPPSQGARGLRWHLDWAEFQQTLITEALCYFRNRFDALLRAQMRCASAVHALSSSQQARTKRELSSDPGCLYSHNLPLGDHFLPMNISQLESTFDIVGADYYHGRENYEAVRQRTQWLTATSRYAYAPEMGVGGPPWFKPLHLKDSLFTLQTAIAYGLKGFNLYMAVQREAWSDALLDDEGHIGPAYSVYRTWLEDLKQLHWSDHERFLDAWVVLPRDYIHLTRVTQTMGPIGAQVQYLSRRNPTLGCLRDNLGFRACIQRDWWQWVLDITSLLDSQNVAYAWVDEEICTRQATRGTLPKHIIVPCFDFISAALCKAFDAMKARGCQIWSGPQRPDFDANIEPYVLDEGGYTRIEKPSDIRIDARSTIFAVDAPLHVTIWHSERHKNTVAFLINPTASSQVSASANLQLNQVRLEAFSVKPLLLQSTLSRPGEVA